MGKVEHQGKRRSRDAVLVEEAHIRPMMGFEILEPLPAKSVPYELSDPFILVHESRLRLSELKDVDTKHPHRGFDNLWYILEGTASTGHSTGPGGRSSARSSRRGRSSRSGPGGARGTPRRSAPRSAMTVWATRSGEACCSG